MPGAPKLIEFRSLLAYRWTYRWKHDKPVQFVDTKRLEEWMSQLGDGSPPKKNGLQLLDEIGGAVQNLPIKIFPDKKEERSYVLILGFLIYCDAGQLMSKFQIHNISDDMLLNSDFRYNVKQRLGNDFENADQILEKFKLLRPHFCPEVLKLPTQDIKPYSVLPFCKLESESPPGGTAFVFRAQVPASFMTYEFKKELFTKMDDKDAGECYIIAVKSFHKDSEGDFHREKKAYRGIEGKPGVLRCLGWIHNKPIEYEGCSFSHHLLLEYASTDLRRYFYTQSPPRINHQIHEFWKSLVPICKALGSIHKLTVEHESKTYKGWHGDVKLDNILQVNNEWKLADFGFTAFDQASDTSNRLRSRIYGGTRTYGAPELFAFRGDGREVRSLSWLEKQKADMWSIGCLLSEAATWVTTGMTGVEEYAIFRFQVRKRMDCSTDFDSFHCNGEVLPQLQYWHSYLRDVRRGSDSITEEILKIVENYLLVPNRISSMDLYQKLSSVLEDGASKSGGYELHPDVARALNKANNGRRHIDGSSLADDPAPEQYVLNALTPTPSTHYTRDSATQPTAPILGRHLTPQNQPATRRSVLSSGFDTSQSSIGAGSDSGSRNDGTVNDDMSHSGELEEPAHLTDMSHFTTASSRETRSLNRDPTNTPYTTQSSGSAFFDSKLIWERVEGDDVVYCKGILDTHPHITLDRDQSGYTPLMKAVMLRKESVLDLLLSASSIKAKDSGGRTILHQAVIGIADLVDSEANKDSQARAYRVFQQVLKFQSPSQDRTVGLALVNELDKDKKLALAYCIRKGNSKNILDDTAKDLIDCREKSRAISDLKIADLMSVLLEAVRCQQVAIVKLLVACNIQYTMDDFKDIRPKVPSKIREHLRRGLSSTSVERR